MEASVRHSSPRARVRPGRGVTSSRWPREYAAVAHPTRPAPGSRSGCPSMSCIAVGRTRRDGSDGRRRWSPASGWVARAGASANPRRRFSPGSRPCPRSASTTAHLPRRAPPPRPRREDDPTAASVTHTSENTNKPKRTVPTYNGLRLLPLWESKPGTEPRQYCLDHGVVRLLLPEEQDAIEHREGTDQSPGFHIQIDKR